MTDQTTPFRDLAAGALVADASLTVHDAIEQWHATFGTDHDDEAAFGGNIASALYQAGMLRTQDRPSRRREPSAAEPQWRIGIEIPHRLPLDVRQELFERVAEVVHDWEPQDRDGWDVNVYGCPADEDEPGEDDATVERVARALERDDAEYAAEIGIVGYKAWGEVPESARDQFRRSARAALRAARGTS